MKRSTSSLMLLALAAVGFGRSSLAAADATGDAIAKLAKGADCGNRTSAHKDWCPIVDWAKGKPAALKPSLMVGLSVAIESDTDVDTALTDDATVIALRVDKDGPQLSATLRDVEGAPGVTTRQVDPLEKDIRARLVGKIRKIKLGKEVRAFTDSLKGDGTRALTKGKDTWTWTTGHSSAEMRQVGKYWVIVETPDDSSTGRVISLLTTDVK